MSLVSPPDNRPNSASKHFNLHQDADADGQASQISKIRNGTGLSEWQKLSALLYYVVLLPSV